MRFEDFCAAFSTATAATAAQVESVLPVMLLGGLFFALLMLAVWGGAVLLDRLLLRLLRWWSPSHSASSPSRSAEHDRPRS